MSDLTKRSKYLSKLLRHKPEDANLTLDKEGFCPIDQLIKADFTIDELEQIVATDEKQRYSFNLDGTAIRANQGHSTDVDITFEKKVPPVTLYHGTTTKALVSIKKNGLKAMNRQYVHLSTDAGTATSVGNRHLKNNESLILLEIDCKAALADGIDFFISENDVWLVKEIPSKYIK